MTTLSKLNPCITPEMERFLKTMTEVAEGYHITGLNESFGVRNGKLKISIINVKKILEEKLEIIDLDIEQRENKNYDITGFVGEVKENKRGKGKEVYISNMKAA